MNIILKNWKTILFLTVGLLVGWYVSNYFSSLKVKDLKNDLKVMVLRTDSLKLLEKNLYTKMVADTLEIKELKNKVKDLKLKIKDPQIVIQKEIVFDTIYTNIGVIKTEQGDFEFEDYYPTKENPFIKYKAKVNTAEQTAKGRFTLQPLSLSSTIGLNEEGEYRINSRVPDFARIGSLDVVSIPQNKRYKKDGFGFIFGGGYNKSFETEAQFLTIQIGVRVNKTYLFLNAGTNQTVGATLMVEF